MSIHIVALGNEGDSFHQDNRPSGLIRTYLGRSPLVSGDESSLLLNATSTVARPVFTEYQASAFGNVKLVVHDCPVWVRGCSFSMTRLTELSFPFFFSPSPLSPLS
uniref:Rho related BTB domain containing 3 n=1 Tax=Rhinolophus ferrumequinum TaxID=59479 RepID=A0A671EF67_RHIFE